MFSATEPRRGLKNSARVFLRARASERVSSLLMALVLIVGCAVIAMLGIYFSGLKGKGPMPIVPEAPGVSYGEDDQDSSNARDFASPGDEAIEKLSEPALEKSLEAVDEVAEGLPEYETDKGGRSEKGPGVSTAGSDRTRLGDSNAIPRYDRWQLKFTAWNQRDYAAQLDFFDIELAAIGGGLKTVDYASGFTGETQKRSDTGENEKRLYFAWRNDSPLAEYERRLMSKIGIAVEDRIIVKFLSEDLERLLAKLEMINANRLQGREVKAREFLSTTFECRRTEAGEYEWVVVDQKLRKPPPSVSQ